MTIYFILGLCLVIGGILGEVEAVRTKSKGIFILSFLVTVFGLAVMAGVIWL
jgi:hypothetical protein